MSASKKHLIIDESHDHMHADINGLSKSIRNKKTKKIACTECRQQKARCDAFERNPDPCTRCTRRNIECRLDGDFKRTFKRAKIDELVKEYEIIKSKLQTNSPSLQGNSPNNFRPSPASDHSSVNNMNSLNSPQPKRVLSPPLQNLQRSTNIIPNLHNNNSIANNMIPNNSVQMNSQNMFLHGVSALPSPVSHLTSDQSNIQRVFHSHSPVNHRPNSPVTNIKSCSPLPLHQRSNSPLNTDLSGYSVSTNNQQNPSSLSMSYNTNNASHVQPTPSVSLNRFGSNYNLTTLISAASANVSTPPVNNTNFVPNNGDHNVAQNGVDADTDVNDIKKTSTSNKGNTASMKHTDSTTSNIQYAGPSVQPIINNNISNWIIKSQSVEKPMADSSMLECLPKTLGEVTLNEEQIAILFKTYVTNYHPLLPVIDIAKGIEKIYRLCPILFWTIMLIALRGHHSLLPVISPEESQSLYFTLSPMIKSVLAEITISPITRYAPNEDEEPILNASSVYSVQSLIIYTFWPPLTSSLSADSSWNTVGIAMYQAIRIGLHSPGHSIDGIKSHNKELLNEQIRTWIACNVVSQTIATVFGYPAFVEPYASLLVMCSDENGITIPKSLKQMLEVQIFEEQVAKTLNSNIFDPLRLNQASDKLPMIQLLDNELNQLELRLCSDPENPMDDFRKLVLYASRIHLLTYNFLDTDLVANFELKRGFIKSYNAASALIQHIKESQDRDPDFVNRLPTAYILTIWQATVIIARLVNSIYKSILDVGTGKTLYQTAITLIMKASVMKHDLAYRSCGIMKSTWNLFRALDEAEGGELKVTVRSRMSASVFFDSLWVLRERCGMIKLRPTDKKNSISESLESDSDVDAIDENNKNNTDLPTPLPVSNDQLRNDIGSDSRADSTSSLRKKGYHHESAARKIINTIPLDPQPIALTESPRGSGQSSTKGSPYVGNYKSPSNADDSTVKKIITPQSLANASSANYSNPGSNPNSSTIKSPQDTIGTGNKNMKKQISKSDGTVSKSNTNPLQFPNIAPENTNGVKNIDSVTNMDVANNAIPSVNTPGINLNNDVNQVIGNPDGFSLDSWIIGDDFDSGMLFKDLDSVMNDFGFHTDY